MLRVAAGADELGAEVAGAKLAKVRRRLGRRGVTGAGITRLRLCRYDPRFSKISKRSIVRLVASSTQSCSRSGRPSPQAASTSSALDRCARFTIAPRLYNRSRNKRACHVLAIACFFPASRTGRVQQHEAGPSSHSSAARALRRASKPKPPRPKLTCRLSSRGQEQAAAPLHRYLQP